MFRAPLLAILTLFAATLPVEVVPAHTAAVRIALVGDVGQGSDRVAKGIAAVNAKTPLSAIVLLGDNFYPSGVWTLTDPRWSRIAALVRLNVAIYPLLGNHDGGSNASVQIAATGHVNNWHFPAREYVVHTPLADIVMLDTNPYATGANRNAEESVRQAFAASTATWRIVAGHHTIVSSGLHGYWPRGEHHHMLALLGALRQAHADLYICGHDHHEEFLATKPPMLVSGAASEPVPPVALHVATRFPPEIGREPIGFSVLEITQQSIVITIYDAAARQRFRTRILKSAKP